MLTSIRRHQLVAVPYYVMVNNRSAWRFKKGAQRNHDDIILLNGSGATLRLVIRNEAGGQIGRRLIPAYFPFLFRQQVRPDPDEESLVLWALRHQLLR